MGSGSGSGFGSGSGSGSGSGDFPPTEPFTDFPFDFTFTDEAPTDTPVTDQFSTPVTVSITMITSQTWNDLYSDPFHPLTITFKLELEQTLLVYFRSLSSSVFQSIDNIDITSLSESQ